MQRRESTKQPPRVRIPRAASHPHAELASVSQEQHCVRALTKSRAGYRLRSGAEPGTALPGSTEHRQRSRRPGRRGWPDCSAPQERRRVSAPSRHRRPEATCVEALAAPPRPCPHRRRGLPPLCSTHKTTATETGMDCARFHIRHWKSTKCQTYV